MSSALNYPLPSNEWERIAALRAYEILDTAPELEFDALTRIAAHTFATPIAVVAMLDVDRLWFKSKIGLTIPQLDRKIAFCAHAIMSPKEALVVEDLRADARFRDNPLVAQAPHLRFYAGAPITDAENNSIGTIAVIDAKPRRFTELECAALADLASVVMTTLQGRRRALELARLAMTDHLTGIGNRAQFEKTIAAEISQVGRGGRGFVVLTMDLDGFKSVNDTHGHAAGDFVLCRVAERLTSLVRDGDTLVRLGGDEFAMLSRNCDHAAALHLAERMTAVVQEPIELTTGASVRVGISIGIATCRDSNLSVDALLAQADAALYRAKHRPAVRFVSAVP